MQTFLSMGVFSESEMPYTAIDYKLVSQNELSMHTLEIVGILPELPHKL